MAQTRAAVIGASGIGKHHAKWLATEGCEVVAFVGQTPESVAKTTETLSKLFPFAGRGYTDVGEMLARERPELVSVCSPHVRHRDHAVAALQAGAHVLCEKPLFWDDSRSAAEVLAGARKMVETARRAGRQLAINTQYVAALPVYEEIYHRVRGPLGVVEQIYYEMESKGGNRGEEIWVDLASHALSIVLRWSPGGSLREETVDCRIGAREVHAAFDYGAAHVEIALRDVSEGTPKRRLGANGLIVNLAGRNDAQGVFRTYLNCEGEERAGQDLVHTSIARFVAAGRGQGEVLASGEEGYRNLALHLALRARARRV